MTINLNCKWKNVVNFQTHFRIWKDRRDSISYPWARSSTPLRPTQAASPAQPGPTRTGRRAPPRRHSAPRSLHSPTPLQSSTCRAIPRSERPSRPDPAPTRHWHCEKPSVRPAPAPPGSPPPRLPLPARAWWSLHEAARGLGEECRERKGADLMGSWVVTGQISAL